MPPWMRTRLTRLIHSTFTVSVAAIIINKNGEVLLLNHVLRPASGWGIPGGFINTGEQPEVAVRREISEETGLQLNDVRLYRVRTVKRHVEVLYLATSDSIAEVRSREITELGWFDADALPSEMNLEQQFLIRKVLRPEV
ncbi:MAG: NUDIX hydrolase [Pyrinomonadaceae bacterium]|nr:NUDIX hydrolase [Pyrinomonadaceae bacterium]MBP6214210.1 NUDIX hydrolase [Pyrinomonadaceae bacterium]